jgi:hypothetical protein
MKRYVLVVISVFVFEFSGAQEKTELTFGFKVGLNVSDITNKDDTKYLLGLHTGFFGEFKFNKKFSIQPELLYSSQGAKFNEGAKKLDYFNMPIMAKYYISDAFDFEVGPQFGFLLSAKQSGIDIRSSFKTTDIGINFGAGYSITDYLLASIRYNLGLRTLQENADMDESKYKNSVVQIALGYKFY